MAGGPISYTGNKRKLGFSDDTIRAAEQYVAIITLCIDGMDSLLLWELVDGGGHSNFCFIPVELVLEATMLRFLDMVFQFLVIFLFLCLNRNPTFGFLVVVLLHLLSLLPIPWLPVGASSLLRLRIEGTGGTFLPVTTTVELVVCNLILLTWIWYYGARYLFGKVEVKR